MVAHSRYTERVCACGQHAVSALRLAERAVITKHVLCWDMGFNGSPVTRGTIAAFIALSAKKWGSAREGNIGKYGVQKWCNGRHIERPLCPVGGAGPQTRVRHPLGWAPLMSAVLYRRQEYASSILREATDTARLHSVGLERIWKYKSQNLPGGPEENNEHPVRIATCRQKLPNPSLQPCPLFRLRLLSDPPPETQHTPK